MRALYLLFIGAVYLLFCGCSSSVASGDGGGTGVGNPVVVAGVAYHKDGTVAAGALIRVREISTIVDDTVYAYLGEEFDSDGSVSADHLGHFSFSLVANGEYRLEVRDSGASMAHMDPLFISDREDTLVVKNVLLLPLDTLRGMVALHGGVAAATVKISAYGSDYATFVDGSGAYALALPRGVYAIDVAVSGTEYRGATILGVSSDAQLQPLRILAMNPLSSDYTTDSLIVRAILDSNYLSGIRVDQVSWRDSITGRIIELDFEPDIEDQSPINISGYLRLIPPCVSGLVALEQLEIQYSYLTTIPASIGSMANLKKLELNDNEFVSLPQELAELKNLDILDLSNNNLTLMAEPLKSWADVNDADWITTQK